MMTDWCRSVAHNELVQVLVPNATHPEQEMVPITINQEAYTDVRLRTVDHDEKVVGDPGCFWMLGAPPEGVPHPICSLSDPFNTLALLQTLVQAKTLQGIREPDSKLLLWCSYQGASGIKMKWGRCVADNRFRIPNTLAPASLQSWAMSLHTATTGIAMDRPIHFGVEEGADHLVQFAGFYRAKQSGMTCPLLLCKHGFVLHATGLWI
jgi:hypothetical protein